ncbi:cellular communication network factor 4b [Brienomyrus brachyistius]|uniref:cellular communication network factor 4b n=1 Tax=Brienomyrus brachyistius TaxID=42636 RepID=UPI0020B3CA13|nr:cellular communication network factor 4b [Brienomyrus brachyistius]
MTWFLPCILIASSVHQVLAQNCTVAPPTPTEMDPYERTRHCRWPCECPASPLVCPPGVSLMTDGCDCCKACAKQVGETCNEADICDYHKGLYCDYSADKPRYEKGVCAYMVGTGCVHDGVIYRNGQSFQPSCRFRCLCINGAIGCLALCADFEPPRVWCQTPRQVRLPGRCCEQWICDDEPQMVRKTFLRHALDVRTSSSKAWPQNCVTQTMPWSPCSKTCDRGLSVRVTNTNDRCQPKTETRLCNIRPCKVDISRHIKPEKKCLNIYRETQSQNFTLSGCVSTRSYRPKYCGVCTDDRCCIPYKSKTIRVDFECPSGAMFSKSVMWISACFCNLSCKNPNDIFADLVRYYDYSEIVN